MPDPILPGNGQPQQPQQPQQSSPPPAAPDTPPTQPPSQPTFEPQFAPDIFDDSGDDNDLGDAGGGDLGSAASLRDHLTQQGVNVGEYSDADLLNIFSHTLAQAQQVPQLQQMAAYGQEYLKYADKIAELQKQEQAPSEPARPEPKWQAPEVNPRALEFAERDPRTGRFKAKDGYESLISPIELNKLNEYDDFIRSKSQEMWKDPYGFMWTGLEDRVAEKVNEIVQSQLTVAQQQQAANDFVSRNMAQFFQMDHNGQLVYDAAGQPQMTQRGQVFAHFANEAEQRYGIQDPIAKQHYAAEKLQAFESQQMLQQHLSQQQQAAPPADEGGDQAGEELAQPPQPPFQTPEQASQQRRKAFSRARSASRGNRSSSSGADNTPPENGNLSFGRLARQVAVDQGMLPQTG